MSVLGVANVDLIYVKLSVLLAAFDKVMKHDPIFKPVAAGPKKRVRSRRKRVTLHQSGIDRARFCA